MKYDNIKVMDDMYQIKYDPQKEFETIFDFHNTQIFRLNSVSDTTDFLSIGEYFDVECVKRVDSEGRIRIIYIADKIPPLSAILKFVSNPFDEVKWGIYAIIVPEDLPTLSKIVPIISYALGITKLRGRFTAKVFDYTHRNNLEEVIKWMDENMKIRKPKIDVKTIGDRTKMGTI